MPDRHRPRRPAQGLTAKLTQGRPRQVRQLKGEPIARRSCGVGEVDNVGVEVLPTRATSFFHRQLLYRVPTAMPSTAADSLLPGDVY